MAFVSESPRNTQAHVRGTGSGTLGPGEYYNEGHLHKLAMEAIYPKKMVPFNSQEIRIDAGEPKADTSRKHVSPGKL